MRTKKTLWKLILEEAETQDEVSIYQAMKKLKFSEEEGDLIFRECLDEESENKDTLQFVNERLKFHNKISQTDNRAMLKNTDKFNNLNPKHND